MSRFWLGVLSGGVYGALSAASMLPLSFPDKRAALLGAFLSRFAIGVAIGASVGSPQLQRLGLPAWAIGLLLGPSHQRAGCGDHKGVWADSGDWSGRWGGDWRGGGEVGV